MDQGPLVVEETDAGAELVRRLDQQFPVKAAFWLKDSEVGHWFLYIASDQIDDKTLDSAYEEVLRVAWEMASPYFDGFQVKVIPPSDPLAQGNSGYSTSFSGTDGHPLRRQSFRRDGRRRRLSLPASVTASAS